MRALGMVILALMAGTAWGADVYTWRDASGKVHYSDSPPPGVEAQRMRGGVAVETAEPPAKRPSLAEQERAFRQRRAEAEKSKEKAEKDKAESDEAKRNCDDARSQLGALESGQRMTRANAQGEQIHLDDQARAQEIERAQKSVKSWCK